MIMGGHSYGKTDKAVLKVLELSLLLKEYLKRERERNYFSQWKPSDHPGKQIMKKGIIET